MQLLRTAFRQVSLSAVGRSAVLVIARRSPGEHGSAGETVVTVTAATPRPLVLRFAGQPEPGDALNALDAAVSPDGAVARYLDDVHGSAPWRAAMTRRCVAEVIAELARSPGPAR